MLPSGRGRRERAANLIGLLTARRDDRLLEGSGSSGCLSIGVDAAKASLRVPDLIEAEARRFMSPATAAAHRVRLQLPDGIEFSEAEFATGRYRTQVPVELHFDDTHAHLANIH